MEWLQRILSTVNGALATADSTAISRISPKARGVAEKFRAKASKQSPADVAEY